MIRSAILGSLAYVVLKRAERATGGTEALTLARQGRDMYVSACACRRSGVL